MFKNSNFYSKCIVYFLSTSGERVEISGKVEGKRGFAFFLLPVISRVRSIFLFFVSLEASAGDTVVY